MKTILVIESSPRGQNSISRRLTEEIVNRLLTKYPNSKITVRDLTKNPFPHLTDDHINAFYTPDNIQSKEQKRLLQLSNEATDELLKTDIIVIGSPMWNWSIPSVLKAWIDHITRVGKTFSYNTEGIKGLVNDKQVYIAVSRGGFYSHDPINSSDFQEPYLKAVLGFLGIKSIQFFYAEGLGSSTNIDEVIMKSRKEIDEVI